jgi:hypothetical protein
MHEENVPQSTSSPPVVGKKKKPVPFKFSHPGETSNDCLFGDPRVNSGWINTLGCQHFLTRFGSPKGIGFGSTGYRGPWTTGLSRGLWL